MTNFLSTTVLGLFVDDEKNPAAAASLSLFVRRREEVGKKSSVTVGFLFFCVYINYYFTIVQERFEENRGVVVVSTHLIILKK